MSDLLERAQRWMDDDPDPATRAELAELLQRADQDDVREDLQDRFSGLLQFGTAGLRGALGAGPHRMNRAVVIRAAAGLAAYLREQVPEGESPRVVVGFDARHNSDVFAADTCAVMAGAGIEAMVLPRPLPTPLVAFAVRHLGCDAGVMVTASHNPPQDNGYKVYLGGRVTSVEGKGVQIVPPADAQIAAAIEAVPSVQSVYRAETGWHTLDDGIVQSYVDDVVALVHRDHLDQDAQRDLRVVVTPMHGVGGAVVVQALTQAGFAEPYLVPEQAEPDPDFPTVPFPNPEEPGAIDLAVKAAREREADLVIANDPDADRCAVAVFDPKVGQDGDWRMLRGDELGALLGQHVIARGVPPVGEVTDRVDPTVACSIVSSQLLGRIAQARGVRHAETLTGFKWIARTPGLIFGYEEAIGYCVAPYLVRDKDGVSAATLICELAASLKASGRTLLDVLDGLAREFGVHATDQLAIRVDDLSLIQDAMARLRKQPPSTLGGQTVTSAEDLLHPDGTLNRLHPTDGLRYRTDGGIRVIVRPSGTEPKLKCYLEAVVDLDQDADDSALAHARSQAAELLQRTRQDLHSALGL